MFLGYSICSHARLSAYILLCNSTVLNKCVAVVNVAIILCSVWERMKEKIEASLLEDQTSETRLKSHSVYVQSTVVVAVLSSAKQL